MYINIYIYIHAKLATFNNLLNLILQDRFETGVYTRIPP